MEMSLLSCPVCLKPHFPGVDALRSSLISVATSHISCPVCQELLLGLDKLTIHLFSHITDLQHFAIAETATVETVVEVPVVIEDSNAETKRVICDICNFHFPDDTILDLHQKLLHQTSPDKATGSCNYHCHLCSKQFRMRGSLMVHLRVAHFGFVQSNHRNLPKTQLEKLQKKKSPVPKDNKQWECEVCLKLFTTKYFLKKHKRLHTGEMPYYCAQCNKYFTFQQSYHKHMLYHSDEKPHVCAECGRAFKELSTLHNHMRIHSGERPFSCETCGKSFRQRVSYLVHRRIHTGAMPYKCTACNKTFRYKVSQRSHKCPINPPGCVVRTPDLVEKLILNRKYNSDVTFSLPTPNLNFTLPLNESIISTYIPDPTANSAKDVSLETGIEEFSSVAIDTDKQIDKSIEPELSLSCTASNDNGQPDFFSLILSPVMSDVQSLHLSAYPAMKTRDRVETLQTINEESLKELLYGPLK